MKLLEVLGEYADRGSIIVFVDKQEHADGLLKVRIIILLRSLKGIIGIMHTTHYLLNYDP